MLPDAFIVEDSRFYFLVDILPFPKQGLVFYMSASLLTLYLTCKFLGLSNSAANKDMTSKLWTNGDTII